ncbi:hypothetical protein [Pseudomonas sp. PA-5-4A]|uniref:hypothetical protein n=1 Tax=Pseudomonas sp. PA-5-4A TaxID=2665477 RepID=UPI001F2AA43E|nr:hypothetical protein [Pseudomonas sp. PA-5-4A]
MISNLVKVALIAGALLLGACSTGSSGGSGDPCFTGGCQAFGDHSPSKAAKMNFGGGGVGGRYGGGSYTHVGRP